MRNWIALDQQPLQSRIGAQIKSVSTFLGDDQEPAYHIVYMEPQGFIIVAGDDAVEPIIGFVPAGEEFTPSLDNPLGALVIQDVPSRVNHARKMEKQATSQKGKYFLNKDSSKTAQKKWMILDQDEPIPNMAFGYTSISDVRVAPLLQTSWNQATEAGGNQCYNLFTPNNYVCGCVATAFAQVMRFWQFPTTAVGTPSFSITVDGVSQNRNLLGGDGAGGAYNWSLMDVGPTVSTLSHRQAIGRLTHDAGVSVNMSYTANGSSAGVSSVADALINTFHYTNAKFATANLNATNVANITNPNLDAGYPVAFGIFNPSIGHAVVGDGYGYNSGTLYHHLNMGWGGSQNAWYNLPNVDDAFYGFTSVLECVYNIYTSGSGEIISGRVTDTNGNPVSGATVTATRTGGGSYSATTNTKGIYALAKIPSSSTYQISVPGYLPRNVNTSISTYSTVGNLWGIDFAVPPYSLNVHSTGAASVAISATDSLYSGTTDYSKTSITTGTNITLTAPDISSGGMFFFTWSGCDSTSGNTCNISMNSNKSVTANYAPTCTLTVNGSGLVGGFINSNPSAYAGNTNYSKAGITPGTTISLTAPSPLGGYTFTNWNGCDSVTGTTCNVTMTSNKTVTASYTPPNYNLYVQSTGVTGVPISSSSGQSGTTHYTKSVPSGTNVELTAPATSGGANFTSWTGCTSTSGTSGAICNVTVSWDTAVYANYTAPSSYLLSVNSTGATGVAIASASGHAGTTNYAKSVTSGTNVTLTAPATSGGANFTSWTGCTSTSGTSGATCNVTVSGDTTVSANYTTPGPYILYVNSIGASGVPISSSTGHAGTTNYNTSVTSGTNVTLIAPTTSGGASFADWTGCDSNSGVTCNLTMNRTKTVTAHYDTAIISLGQAVDNTNLTWTTGGNGIWIGQSIAHFYGGSAAESGSITDNQQSYIQTIVTGPGTLRFYWKVSSEANFDYLRFFIDGAEQNGSISGIVEWTQKAVAIPAGSHTLKWSYTKDGSVSANEDFGWLDKVEWTPSTSQSSFPWPMFLPAMTHGHK